MMQMEETLLKLNEFGHNHHSSEVKMLAKKSDVEFGCSKLKTYSDIYGVQTIICTPFSR